MYRRTIFETTGTMQAPDNVPIGLAGTSTGLLIWGTKPTLIFAEMNRQMILSAILRLAAGIIRSAVAFLSALLPERLKDRKPYAHFQSNIAHFFSGLSECAFSLALFAYGYHQFVGGIILGESHALAEKSSEIVISEAQMRGMGVLGFILYLILPVALLSLYLTIEGGVRSFAAALTGRRHGVAAFWAVDRIIQWVRTKRREANRRRRLGPERRDFLRKDETSCSLVLISIEDKDWREHQVAQCGEDFYVLSAKNFVQKGKYFRYQYTFRRRLPGEIIRGRIAALPSLSPQQ